MEFTLKWPKNKFLGCVGVKAFPLACISSGSENDLEGQFSFTRCGHATLFKAERIFSANKVAPLPFKCKS